MALTPSSSEAVGRPSESAARDSRRAPGACESSGGPFSAPGGEIVTADIWPHPLTAQGREARAIAAPKGITLAELIAGAESSGALSLRYLRADMPAPGPGDSALKQRSGSAEIAAYINGRPVPPGAWAQTRLRAGQIVTLRAALADGGGDKNPLAAILQIATLVAAIVVPPLLFASSWAQAITGAAITIAGGLIVNALAPPRAPDAALPEPGAAPQPIYSLRGGANRARPYEPLLLVMGAHRVFPDLSAAEYTEIIDGEQYLHQIFNFGLGNLAIDDFRIGETPLRSYEEVQLQRDNAPAISPSSPATWIARPGARLRTPCLSSAPPAPTPGASASISPGASSR